mgnify:CR=1 FL=1
MFIIYIMTICIAPYLPREGPETRPKMAFHRCVGLLDIATYLPREGPETFVNVVSSYFYSSVYLPIYLARGRKQIPLLFLDLVTVKYSYLSTSRGAGNVLENSLWNLILECIVSYLAREGPETLFVVSLRFSDTFRV